MNFNRYFSNAGKALFLYKYLPLKLLKLSDTRKKNEELVEFIVKDMLEMIKTFKSYEVNGI